MVMYVPAKSSFSDARPRPLALSVVVPTYNERPNVTPLLEKLDAALVDVEWEAIFVDDGSTDGTPELIAQIAVEQRHGAAAPGSADPRRGSRRGCCGPR